MFMEKKGGNMNNCALVLLSGIAFSISAGTSYPASHAPYTWVDFGSWLGAIATLLAVVVALRLHVRVIPPKLRLALRSPNGEATTAVLTKEENGVVVSTSRQPARYYHLV